jgi:spore coat polysaccharide biosynthesis predicted glycosyltransferase SpsG
MSKKVLFFIDVGKGSGRGHLMRSMQLIKEFKKKKWFISVVIEKCDFDVFIKELKEISDSVSEVSIKSIEYLTSLLKFAENLNCNYLIIDSYKLIYDEIQTSPSTTIYRIVDKPSNQIEHIQDIKIGVRFGLQHTNKGPKILYPMRTLPVASINHRKEKRVLFYFGSEPNSNLVKASVEVIQRLPLEIEPYVYTAKHISNEGRIRYIDSIDEVLNNISIIVGSASGIIYEAAALKIPMITISTNESQINSDAELLLIGSVFNLTFFDLNDADGVANLINNMISESEMLRKSMSSYQNNLYLDSSQHIVENIVEGFDQISDNEEPIGEDTSQLSFRTMDISYINEILKWRNSNQVRQLMNVNSEITRLNHYNWWFENKRSNYIVFLDGEAYLYLWHELIYDADRKFFIGGWMPVTSKPVHSLIAEVLNWQLLLTKSISSDATWLAIINKQNIFTIFVNERLGFRKVEASEELGKVISKIFKLSSSNDNFYFYKHNFTS